MPDAATTLVLCLAAAMGGWIDAVSGGGGLVQLPALLVALPGAAPAQVLATNKLSSFCGTAVASATYYRRVRPDLRTVAPMVLCAVAGSALGAAAATRIPASAFRPLVVVLLLAVGTYTLRRPTLGDVQVLRFTGRRHYLAAAAVAFAIGGYDGIFGPGTGAFLTVALVSLLGYSFLQAAAKARLTNLATNAGALAVFFAHGDPMVALGLTMGACNLAGGWLGARTAIRRGSGFVRVVLLVVVGALVLRLGYDVARDLA